MRGGWRWLFSVVIFALQYQQAGEQELPSFGFVCLFVFGDSVKYVTEQQYVTQAHRVHSAQQ